ncbi:DUF4232 domain-containing protein [Streptomyces sp. NPDC004267]|uniref:DUF4232 domain-containing protein n=1 Tax=Streptomyces sp. NPDC004267 TaxID=3364694 RepID=UPI0036CFFF6B
MKHKAAFSVAFLAAASLSMTACSSSSNSSSSPSAPSPAPSAPTTTAPTPTASGAPNSPSAPAAQPSSPSSPSSPGGSGRQAGSSSPAGTSGGAPKECATSQLSAALTTPEPAAGSIYATLVFTNRSTVTCTMTGYPGVSYVAKNGVQSGNAAVREPGTTATVTLHPGGRAKAALRDANGVSGYDPAQCALSPAEGLRIYPPDQKAALFVPWKTEHCAGPTVHALTIAPVKTG